MQLDQVRERSKILLGSLYRLEVAAAIANADPGVVHIRGLADQLRLSDGLVRAEMLHFEKAGLLLRLPRPKGQQQQDFERMPSIFWRMSQILLDELRQKSESSGPAAS